MIQKDIEKYIDEQVRKYNNQIRELLDIIGASLVGNPLVETIHRRFRVALSIDRTYIIEETTPELMEYRDLIAEEKWDTLIRKDWESKIDKQNNQMMYEVDNKSLSDMVGLLRNLWNDYTVEQKQYVKKSMKKLLSYCIKYHKAKLESRS